jgi:hypothetical protein
MSAGRVLRPGPRSVAAERRVAACALAGAGPRANWRSLRTRFDEHGTLAAVDGTPYDDPDA